MAPHILEIIRLETSNKFGTFGVLRINKVLFCNTLEPPNKENKVNESSIPTGQYFCQMMRSPKFGETFEVTKVPGRSHILFHKGNVVEHTSGCIILGEHIGKLRTDRAVLNSGATFKRFMNTLKGELLVHLTIVESY